MLVIHSRGRGTRARVKSATRPFDVSLGPDARGGVVALYTRCRREKTGCDVYRYDLASQRERKVAAVSSPDHDEAWPAQWRNRIAFVRRGIAYIRNPLDRRPAPGGKRTGFRIDCDVPYVRTLTAGSTSRRLDRSQCGETTSLAIRGARIVHVASDQEGEAGSETQVRVLRASGGATRTLARAGGGLNGFSAFASVNQSASDVWLTRTGSRRPHNFLRIDLRSGRMSELEPHVPLAGRVARDERGRFWYLQGVEPGRDGDTGCSGSVLQPCRLVRASADPFSAEQRRLAPRLALTLRDVDSIHGAFTDTLTVMGDARRDVVSASKVVRTEHLAGVAVELLRGRPSILVAPSAYDATGVTTTSDANGRWSFSLTRPPSYANLAVVARSLGLATPNIELTVEAAMTLSASGRTLTGTIAPAQPGRTVVIQRMTSVGPPVWANAAAAVLSADGTAFSATVPGPGIYQAVLAPQPSTGTPIADPGAYTGVSPAARVG